MSIDGFLDALPFERCREVRLADNLGDREAHLQPGEGNIDFASLFARLEGAGYFRSLFSVVLPLLRPTTFFALVLATIAGLAGLQAFDLIYVMTQGGPANSTSLGIFYIYQQAFRGNQFGYASAMAVWYALALIVLTGIAFWLTKGGRFEQDDR
jgi:multiple sugar transport system permease protein